MKRSQMMFPVAALILCAGYTSNGFAGPKAKTPVEPVVKAVSAPSFNSTDLKKVAIVWPNKQRSEQEDASQQTIEDEFTMALMEKGYSVAARSDVQAILKEQQFQRESGMTDADVSKIGKLLNVSAVMVVNVSDLKSERAKESVNLGIIRFNVQQTSNGVEERKFVNYCSMGARLLGVEKGEILWFGKVTTSSVSEGQQDFSESVKKAAGAIAQAMPERKQEAKKEETKP